MISQRAFLFAGLAIGLNLLLILLLGAVLLSLNIGLALIFVISFILVPFIAGWLAGYRSPIQLVILFGATILVGSLLEVTLHPAGIFVFISSVIVYVSAAMTAEMIVR